MHALRSRVSRRSKADDAHGVPAGRTPGVVGREGHAETRLPNLLSRILRTSKSKKSLKHLRSKSEPDTATAYEKAIPIDNAPDHVAHTQATCVETSTRLDRSYCDSKLTTGGEKRPPLPSMERAQQPVSGPSLEESLPAVMEAEDKAGLSAVLPAVQTSVADPKESNIRPGLRDSAEHQDNERPVTAGTADSVPLIGSGVTIEGGEDERNQLQPAPCTAPQHHHQTEESSDYQDFIHEAFDGGHEEREQLWAAITDRPGKKKFVPDHPDLMDVGAGLERSGTFGKASRQKEPKEPKKKDAPRRTSFYGAKSRDDKSRRSQGGGDVTSHAPDAPGPKQRRRSSAARRLSDYFKPSREPTAPDASRQPLA